MASHDLSDPNNESQVPTDFEDVVNAQYWLFVLASPPLYATLSRSPVRDHLLRLMDVYIAYAERGGRYSRGRGDALYERREPIARKLRALMETWAPPELPREIVDTARELLEADGQEAPEGGWDHLSPGGPEPVEDILLWPEGVPKLLRKAAGVPPNEQPSEAPRQREERAPGTVSVTFGWHWNGWPIIDVKDEAPPSRRPSLLSDMGDVCGAINWFRVMAIPPLWRQLNRMPTREHLIHLTEVFMSYVERGEWYLRGGYWKRFTEQRAELARKLRGLLETWTPPGLPADITSTARDLLAVEGIDPPEGGWDAFVNKAKEPLEDILLWPEGIPLVGAAPDAPGT